MAGWTKQNVAEAARMWAAGVTTAKIGEALSVSKRAVIGLANRNRSTFPIRGKRAWAKEPIPSDQGQRIIDRMDAAPIPDGARCVPLVEIESGQCRWIVRGTGADALYCGAGVHGSASWCKQHAKMAHND